MRVRKQSCLDALCIQLFLVCARAAYRFPRHSNAQYVCRYECCLSYELARHVHNELIAYLGSMTLKTVVVNAYRVYASHLHSSQHGTLLHEEYRCLVDSVAAVHAVRPSCRRGGVGDVEVPLGIARADAYLYETVLWDRPRGITPVDIADIGPTERLVQRISQRLYDLPT